MKLLLTLLCGFCGAGFHLATPHLTNPGFEQIDERNGFAKGWSFTFSPGQSKLVQYEVHRLTTDRNSNALSITVAADHPEQQVAYNVWQDLTDVETGKSYQVTARVKTRGLGYLPFAVVQCIDATGDVYLDVSRSDDRELEQDVEEWETISVSFTVPEETSTVRLRIGVPATGNAGGTATIDDVEVTGMK